jgi:hypothetical protein
VYRIKVENPLGVCRGVVNVEVDGVAQTGKAITLVDEEKTHQVKITMGEPQMSTDSTDQKEEQRV